MLDDVLLNKKVSLERCRIQIEDYYHRPSELTFAQDFFKQDAIAINLQRMAELVIEQHLQDLIDYSDQVMAYRNSS